MNPEIERNKKLLQLVSSLGKRPGIDDLVNSDEEGNESTINLYNRIAVRDHVGDAEQDESTVPHNHDYFKANDDYRIYE